MVKVYTEDIEEAMAVWQEVRGEEAAWGEYKEFRARSLKWFIESSLRDAADRKIGAGWYKRSDGRHGWRNGSYIRKLVTPYGTVDIEVPRLRKGTYEHNLFDRKGLLTKEANDLILETYLSGPSTRRVGEVLERVLGYRVSAGTVSAICKGLDGLLRQYWRSELTDEWRHLSLDGVVMKNRSALGVERRVVLTAMGLSKAGKKQILSFGQVESESEACWTAFLEGLYRRGLKGGNLEMITTDGSLGLEAAISTIWSNVPHQGCWVHKLRNLANKLRKTNQRECLAGAKKIYLAENRREAVGRFKEWRDRWQEVEPRAVTCLEKDIEKMLCIFDMPEEDRVTMRTTNGIERVFREVRRRTRTISCFTNRKSVNRIVFALFTYQNRKWEAQHLSRKITHKT